MGRRRVRFDLDRRRVVLAVRPGLWIEVMLPHVGHAAALGEGLNALTSPPQGQQPFMPSIPKDPWGNDFQYIYPGQHNSNGFDLYSYGPDGQAGNDDIGNWTEAAQ